MQLTITAVDHAPADLAEQVPLTIELLREIPGTDRPDYWIGALRTPIRWRGNDGDRLITHVVVVARWQDTRIAPGIRDLPVGLAYVTDPSLLTDPKLDMSKCAYVAIGISSETAVDGGWHAGTAYEDFMGRWSRRVAERFIEWLAPEPRLTWLDIGCGTGALTETICRHADPAAVVACDPSEPFVEHVRARIADPRVQAVVGRAGALPTRAGGYDRIVSGLVLNFIPDPQQAVAGMLEALRSGGVVSAYVWDYAGRMDFLRLFWEEAVALNPAAAGVDERARFPLCDPAALEALFRGAGARDVRSGALEIPTRFASFEDYWRPFLGETGPAPSYVASLDKAARARLRARLEHLLAPGGSGAIDLVARAWTVRGGR